MGTSDTHLFALIVHPLIKAFPPRLSQLAGPVAETLDLLVENITDGICRAPAAPGGSATSARERRLQAQQPIIGCSAPETHLLLTA